MNIPLNIDWQQIVLHLFNFIILCGGLYLLLYKPIKQFMDTRIMYYKDLEDAAKAKLADAEETKAEYLKKLEKAEEEIEAGRVKAAKELIERNEKEAQHAFAEAEKIIAEAKKAAEREYEKAISNAQKDIADMAMDAAQKLVYQSVSDSFDGFLDIAEQESTVNE